MSAMGSVWKRLQRVNKRAAKFQFTASYHELCVETTPKWRPSNLSMVWTRRSRRVVSEPLPWEPEMMNPLVGRVAWAVPDNHVITVTLFKDPRTHEMEDKDWTFVLEDINSLGKKRVLANASINMRQYASIQSTQQTFILNLKPVSRKITAAEIELTISCVFLMEGKATDEDMQSVVSLMSVNNNCDVAPLDDLEDIKDLETGTNISDDLYDITNQLEQMTTSLNGSANLLTPLSDATPLAEINNVYFDQHERQHDVSQAKATLIDDNKVVEEEEEAASVPVNGPLKTPNADTLPSSSTTPSATSIAKATPQQENECEISEMNFTMECDIECNIVYTSTPKKKKHNDSVVEDANQLSFEQKSPLSDMEDISQKQILEKKILPKSTPDWDTTTGMSDSAIASAIIKDSIENCNTSVNTQANELFINFYKEQREADGTGDDKQRNLNEESLQCENPIMVSDIKKSPLPSSASSITTTNTSTTSIKRPALQPLNLKKSYSSIDNTHNQLVAVNSTINNGITNATTVSTTTNTTATQNIKPVANGHVTVATRKSVEKIILKENTPGQDLLEWCKEVTKDYPNIMVTNLTTSWRNGMAFCAIIHHYQPDLIDMSQLRPENVEINCRLAFDVAESLGIPRVIEPRDMKLLKVPDKLAVITYLYQLRAHFTGEQLEIESLGPTSDESSYIIGNYKTDNLSSQNLMNLSHLKAHLLHQNSIDDDTYGITDQKNQISPTAKKDVKNFTLKGSKNIIGKVLSPSKDGEWKENMDCNKTEVKEIKESPEKGKRLYNNTQEAQLNPAIISPTKAALDPLKTNKILSRHKEQSEKARLMMEKLKMTQIDRNVYDEERQQRLREQARRLILETRNKSSESSRPTSPTKTVVTIVTTITTTPTTTTNNTTTTPAAATTTTTIITAKKHDNSPVEHKNSSSNSNDIKTDNKYSVQSCSTITTTMNNDEVANIPNTTTTSIITATETTTKTSTTPTKKHNTPPRDNANKLTNHNNNNNNSNTSDSSSNNNISNKSSPPSLSSHRLSERFINGTSPLQSFNTVMERISPKNEKKQPDKLAYIESELEALEREQEAIDKKASSLEKKLRAVMGGNPSNKRSSSRNPFIRLIRNSIGGGETIRIKLLDLENDEFSLANSSGNSDTDSTSSSPTSEDEAPIKQKRQQQPQQQEQQPQQRPSPLSTHDNNKDEEKLHNTRPIPPPRTRNSRIRKQRSKSCFIETTKHHYPNYTHHILLDDNIPNYSSRTHPTTTTLNSTSQPYTLLSSNSSNPSSCDNFQICSDEDGNVPLKVKRRRRRHRNNYTRSHNHHTNKKHNKRGPGSSSGGVGGGETEETEEQLLSQWFTLVNKKNALLRRQMQLNILEQESDLERKYAMLIQELRAAQSVEEWRKTDAQREKERLLLEDLISIVNKRNELVQRLHNEEIAIKADHEIARELEQVDIRGGKEKCVIQ